MRLKPYGMCRRRDRNNGGPDRSARHRENSRHNNRHNNRHNHRRTITAQTEAEAKPSAGLSGKVVVYMPSPAGLADKLAAGFEEKTGVKVESFQGTTGEILARLEAEQANPVADVVILASWADGLSMKKDGQLMAYEAVGTDRMNPDWVDEEHMLYGTSASAVV